MRLSDLQTKDVVSTKDGRRLGRIIDVEIDPTSGSLLHLIIESKKNIRSFIGSGIDSTIPFSAIKKIGEDVILVDI